MKRKRLEDLRSPPTMLGDRGSDSRDESGILGVSGDSYKRRAGQSTSFSYAASSTSPYGSVYGSPVPLPQKSKERARRILETLDRITTPVREIPKPSTLSINEKIDETLQRRGQKRFLIRRERIPQPNETPSFERESSPGTAQGDKEGSKSEIFALRMEMERVEELKSKLAAEKEEKDEFGRQFLESQKIGLQYQKMIDELRGKCEKVSAERDELKGMKEELGLKASQLEKKSASFAEKKKKMEDDLKHEKKKVTELEKQVADLKSAASVHENKVKELKKKIFELELSKEKDDANAGKTEVKSTFGAGGASGAGKKEDKVDIPPKAFSFGGSSGAAASAASSGDSATPSKPNPFGAKATSPFPAFGSTKESSTPAMTEKKGEEEDTIPKKRAFGFPAAAGATSGAPFGHSTSMPKFGSIVSSSAAKADSQPSEAKFDEKEGKNGESKPSFAFGGAPQFGSKNPFPSGIPSSIEATSAGSGAQPANSADAAVPSNPFAKNQSPFPNYDNKTGATTFGSGFGGSSATGAAAAKGASPGGVSKPSNPFASLSPKPAADFAKKEDNKFGSVFGSGSGSGNTNGQKNVFGSVSGFPSGNQGQGSSQPTSPFGAAASGAGFNAPSGIGMASSPFGSSNAQTTSGSGWNPNLPSALNVPEQQQQPQQPFQSNPSTPGGFGFQSASTPGSTDDAAGPGFGRRKIKKIRSKKV